MSYIQQYFGKSPLDLNYQDIVLFFFDTKNRV